MIKKKGRTFKLGGRRMTDEIDLNELSPVCQTSPLDSPKSSIVSATDGIPYCTRL